MTAQADEPLTVKFRSRALLDAAVSSYGKESVQGYYRLEDFRVGFKATYRQYEMKGANRQMIHRGPWNEKDAGSYLTELQIPLRMLNKY